MVDPNADLFKNHLLRVLTQNIVPIFALPQSARQRVGHPLHFIFAPYVIGSRTKLCANLTLQYFFVYRPKKDLAALSAWS